VIEAILSDVPGPQVGHVIDVIMLVGTGRRLRTEAEFGELLASTGFRLDGVSATASGYNV